MTLRINSRAIGQRMLENEHYLNMRVLSVNLALISHMVTFKYFIAETLKPQYTCSVGVGGSHHVGIII